MALAEVVIQKTQRRSQCQSLTPNKKAAFCKALAECGTVKDACGAAGIFRQQAYVWRDEDSDFRRDWQHALEDFYDSLERVAIDRAKEKSDLLLIFDLKGARPEKYRDNAVVEHKGNVTQTVMLAAMTAEEREARIQALLSERQLALGTGRSSTIDDTDTG